MQSNQEVEVITFSDLKKNGGERRNIRAPMLMFVDTDFVFSSGPCLMKRGWGLGLAKEKLSKKEEGTSRHQ